MKYQQSMLYIYERSNRQLRVGIAVPLNLFDDVMHALTFFTFKNITSILHKFKPNIPTLKRKGFIEMSFT